MSTTKTLEDQKKEWQQRYGKGNCYELTADGKSVFVFDPTVEFSKAKGAITARAKSLSHLVDYILNNCFLGGDQELKTDEAFKMGVEEQIDNMIDLPEKEVENLENGNVLVKIAGSSIELKKVTRIDKRYANDRNPDNKPLLTAQYLLDRIALEQNSIDEFKKNPKAYLVLLLEVSDLKDKKEVELKKF